MAVAVAVLVVVLSAAAMQARVGQAAPGVTQDCEADPGHQQPGRYLQKAADILRPEVGSGKERQNAQGKDAHGVRQGNDHAQENGVDGGPAIPPGRPRRWSCRGPAPGHARRPK